MLVDDLKGKFAVLEVNGLGGCIVVPGAEFNPDWEALLDDEGFNCINDVLDGAPVTFVQLTKAAAKPFVPPQDNPVFWQPQEDELLIKLWNTGLSVSKIAQRVEAEFPRRKGIAAKQRLSRLQSYGKICSRHKNHDTLEVKKELNEKTENKNVILYGPRWTIQEQELLCKRWKEVSGSTEARAKALAPEFPGRTAKAIELKARKLTATKKEKAVVGIIEKTVSSLETERRLEVLEQGYDALSKSYVELKTDVEKRLEHLACNYATQDETNQLEAKLAKHKHAVTGEAMQPMEDS